MSSLISRRAALVGLFAPAVVSATNIMPVKLFKPLMVDDFAIPIAFEQMPLSIMKWVIWQDADGRMLIDSPKVAHQTDPSYVERTHLYIRDHKHMEGVILNQRGLMV